MRTQEEFDAYYQNHLLPNADVLSKEKNIALYWWFVIVPVFLLAEIALLAFLIYIGRDSDAGLTGSIVLGLLVAAAVVIIVFAKSKYDSYNAHYKELIIGHLVDFIQEGLLYKPEGYIGKDVFSQSKIYTLDLKDVTNNYKGHDLVEGKLNKTAFSFSVLYIRRIVSKLLFLVGLIYLPAGLLWCGGSLFILYSGIFKNHTYRISELIMGSISLLISFWLINGGWKAIKENFILRSNVIFKGIFFTADFNKNFSGKTFVFSNSLEAMLDDLVSNFKLPGQDKGELVTLENPDFKKEFSVYSNDQVEARYILSPALMERIQKFQVEAKSKVILSFVKSSVFVAIPVREDLFQAKLFSAVLDKSVVERYFYYLQLAVGIVEELDLNTRLWTKA